MAQSQTPQRPALTRQIIYLLVAAAIIVPLLTKMRTPVKPSGLSRRVYDKFEALPEGSPVLMSFDYDPSSKEELYPMSLALLRHAFQRNLHPIVMTHWASGVGLAKEVVEKAATEAGKESGKDYVLLGFKPGNVNLILNMGESLKGAFDQDYYKKPTEEMPALAGVESLRDIPLAVVIAAGETTRWWIAYGRDRFHFDLVGGCTAVIAPDLYPWLQTRQLDGFLGGLRGAADYEVLIDKPDDAVKGMPPQTVTHALIIALILIANVLAFLRGRKAGSKGS